MNEATIFIFLMLVIPICTVFGGLVSIALWGKPKWPWFTSLLLIIWLTGNVLFALLADRLIDLDMNTWGALCPSLLWFGIGFLFFDKKRKTLP